MSNDRKHLFFKRLTLKIKVNVMDGFIYSGNLIRRPFISFRLSVARQDEEKATYALTNGEMQPIVCFRYVRGGNVTLIIIFRMGQGEM